MICGLCARMSSTSMRSLASTPGSLFVRNTSEVAASLARMSRPSSVVRSRARLCLPAVGVLEQRVHVGGNGDDSAGRQTTHRVAALDVLDLDHLGAPVGQQRRRRGHERVLRHLEDAHAFHHCGHRSPLHMGHSLLGGIPASRRSFLEGLVHLKVSLAQLSSGGASSGHRPNNSPPAARAAERSIHSRSPHGGSTRRAFGSSSATRSDVCRV